MRNLHAMFLAVLVYALVGFFNFASAQTLSVFLGPYEVNQYGYFQSIGELYHRYTHPYIGVIFLFQTDEDYLLPVDGETWELVYTNEDTGTVLGKTILTYDSGIDCLVDEAGTRAICGLYPENGTELHYLSIAYNTRCIDEVRHSIGVTMNDGSSPDGAPFDFVAQRFRPKLIDMQIPDSISPELPGDTFASIRVPSQDPGQANISFRVVDDYNCQRLLGSTEIEISNRVVSGSSGHAHFGTDDQGSGRYIPQNESDQFESGIPYEIAGKTDDQSIFDTLYEAGDLGVTENVRITMIRPPRENEPDEIRVTKNVDLDIKVSGLVRLQPSSVDPFIFAYGGSCPHPAEEGSLPSQQYVTVLAEAQFILVDRIYNELTGNHLSFNDASLPFGGRFENQHENGRDANCHSSHRRGIDIDVNNAADAQGLSMEREITYRGVPFTAVDLLTAEVHGRLQVERLPEEPIHYRYMGHQTGGEG